MIQIKQKFWLPIAVVLIFLLTPAPSRAIEWQTWQSDDYGYSMPMPNVMKIIDRDYGKGWQGYSAVSEKAPVAIFALVHPNGTQDLSALEKFAREFAGTAKAPWEPLGEIAGQSGWSQSRLYRIPLKNQMVLCRLGQGGGRAYVFLLSTQEKDFVRHEKEYRSWLDGIEIVSLN